MYQTIERIALDISRVTFGDSDISVDIPHEATTLGVVVEEGIPFLYYMAPEGETKKVTLSLIAVQNGERLSAYKAWGLLGKGYCLIPSGMPGDGDWASLFFFKEVKQTIVAPVRPSSQWGR